MKIHLTLEDVALSQEEMRKLLLEKEKECIEKWDAIMKDPQTILNIRNNSIDNWKSLLKATVHPFMIRDRKFIWLNEPTKS